MSDDIKLIEHLSPIYKYLETYIARTTKNEQNIEKFKQAFKLITSDSNYLKEEIKHALDTAMIIANEIKLGSNSIISGILHQFPEKYDNYNDILQKDYDQHVLDIINGVNKIKEISCYRNLKKILLSFVGDIRIVLVRIAEKLAFLRKFDKINEQHQYKIILETKYIYLPLTDRLGLNNINNELDDYCLKYLKPNIYYTIAKKLVLKKDEREDLLNKFTGPLEKELKEFNINFIIKKRTKSIASIWNKIKKRGIPFKEVYDLSALRIILNHEQDLVKEKKKCWRTFNIIKDIYKIKDNRTRDWLTKPKPNGYEALHLTVVNEYNYWAEIQIRSQRMDNLAERGSAAHWKYKNDNISKVNIPGIHEWMDEIKFLLENNKFAELEDEKLKNLSLYSNAICVLDENQNTIKLPSNSTLLDFVFEINSQKALFFTNAKINNKNVKINHLLQNGDTIESFYGDKFNVNNSWIDLVNSQKAKNIINSFLQYNMSRHK
ncbi:MAG: bifunctional (p)ppGpp synthetase/guanosine-3',5'-bis(diphosphate) 3'-pyrophosphohydrolase [Bacteroidetes bacterium]|nr:bifunctional (p)ppGpp synthetase/guanosine-3',5'-bis(diphosphate) 3'-pyrophosphohydrolase [Bacteroidota bacterium]